MLDQPLRITGLNVKRVDELEKKVEKFDSTLAQLSETAYSLSDAIRNYAEQLNVLNQAERNHLHGK
jgi:prefoldin subunit 5